MCTLHQKFARRWDVGTRLTLNPTVRYFRPSREDFRFYLVRKVMCWHMGPGLTLHSHGWDWNPSSQRDPRRHKGGRADFLFVVEKVSFSEGPTRSNLQDCRSTLKLPSWTRKARE